MYCPIEETQCNNEPLNKDVCRLCLAPPDEKMPKSWKSIVLILEETLQTVLDSEYTGYAGYVGYGVEIAKTLDVVKKFKYFKRVSGS